MGKWIGRLVEGYYRPKNWVKSKGLAGWSVGWSKGREKGV